MPSKFENFLQNTFTTPEGREKRLNKKVEQLQKEVNNFEKPRNDLDKKIVENLNQSAIYLKRIDAKITEIGEKITAKKSEINKKSNEKYQTETKELFSTEEGKNALQKSNTKAVDLKNQNDKIQKKLNDAKEYKFNKEQSTEIAKLEAEKGKLETYKTQLETYKTDFNKILKNLNINNSDDLSKLTTEQTNYWNTEQEVLTKAFNDLEAIKDVIPVTPEEKELQKDVVDGLKWDQNWAWGKPGAEYATQFDANLNTLLKTTLSNFQNGKIDFTGIAEIFNRLLEITWFKQFLQDNKWWGRAQKTLENIEKWEQKISDVTLEKDSFVNDIKWPKDRDDINKWYIDGEKSANASTWYDKYKVEEIWVGQINNVDYKFKLIWKYSGNDVDKSINSLQKDSAVQIWINDPSGDNWKVTEAEPDGTIKLERPKTKTTKSVYEGKEWYKIETKDWKKTETLTFTIKNFKEIKQKDAIDGSKIFTDTKNKDQVTVNEQLKTFNPNLYVEQFNKIHTTEPKLTLEKLKENKTREAIKQAIDEKLRITTKESFLNALTTLLLTDKLGKYYPTQEIPKT